MSYPVLRFGSRGIYVGRLQTILKKLGYNIVVDSNFGNGTMRMVKIYQSSRGLVADGFVGVKTWVELLKDEERINGEREQSNDAEPQLKTMGSVKYVELDPMDIKLHMENTTGAKINLKNFMNASFVWWEDYPKNTKPYPTSILVYEGKIINNKQPNGFWSGVFKGKGAPTPTFIIYKDGRITVEDRNQFTVAEAKGVHLAVSGIAITPKLRNTGFVPYVGFESVAYKTNSIAIGYDPKKNKIILAYHYFATAGQMGRYMADLGCNLAVRTDSGGSANFGVNGKKIRGSGRWMSAWLTW